MSTETAAFASIARLRASSTAIRPRGSKPGSLKMEPTTERIVPPKTGLPSMNTDLLARYGMNVLPGPDPLRPAEH